MIEIILYIVWLIVLALMFVVIIEEFHPAVTILFYLLLGAFSFYIGVVFFIEWAIVFVAFVIIFLKQNSKIY